MRAGCQASLYWRSSSLSKPPFGLDQFHQRARRATGPNIYFPYSLGTKLHTAALRSNTAL